MKATILSLCGAAVLLLSSGAVARAQESDAEEAQTLLDPWYAQLRDRISLPRAAANPTLPASAQVTRLAFGSCNHQSLSQDYWATIARFDPQLFLMIGDNVYGDQYWSGDASLATLRAAFAEQAGHPQFRAFRSRVPMMAVWDDHDYGFNDGGRDFIFRRWAEAIHEHFWDASAAVRARPGVYDSAVFGPQGRRVQIVLLDTRYFRTRHRWMKHALEPRPLGRHLPDTAQTAQMLGEEQWRWLEAELARPADLRLIVSSIQVLTDAHRHESWSLIPQERARLYRALKSRAGGGVLLLSGDRHRGAFHAASPAELGDKLWEFTSSSLNLPYKGGDRSAEEPDPLRRGVLTGDENFGLIDIDWRARALVLSLMGRDGQTIAQQSVQWHAP